MSVSVIFKYKFLSYGLVFKVIKPLHKVSGGSTERGGGGSKEAKAVFESQLKTINWKAKYYQYVFLILLTALRNIGYVFLFWIEILLYGIGATRQIPYSVTSYLPDDRGTEYVTKIGFLKGTQVLKSLINSRPTLIILSPFQKQSYFGFYFIYNFHSAYLIVQWLG